MFPPRNHSATKSLTATLIAHARIEEVITIHEKFL